MAYLSQVFVYTLIKTIAYSVGYRITAGTRRVKQSMKPVVSDTENIDEYFAELFDEDQMLEWVYSLSTETIDDTLNHNDFGYALQTWYPRDMVDTKLQTLSVADVLTDQFNALIKVDYVSTRNILELCDRTNTSPYMVLDAMRSAEPSQRRWCERYVHPTNHITTEYQLSFKDLKSICGDCIFQTQIMCARLAALFIDKVLIHTSNNLLVRNMIDTDTDEAMDNKREDLLDKLMFKHYRKAPRSVSRIPDSEAAEPISAISLKKLMTNHGSLFHEYSRLVMKWDHDNTNTDEFSLCTPFRGRLLDDEHYDESYLTKCLDWLRDTIADKQLATFEAILDFLEHTCRFKNAKAGVCLVLYSVAKETGKSVFMDMIESVVGGYNAAIESGSISRTVGDRNAHIIGKKVALIDELKTCSASSKCGGAASE